MSGLPSITITFRQAAEDVSRRAGQGVVAMILTDAAEDAQGVHQVAAEADIPAALGEDNKDYMRYALIGNINRPAKIIAYVKPSTETMTVALGKIAAYDFDWLVGGPDLSSEDATTIKTWISTQRADYDKIYKAVLPNVAADSESIVNFVADDIVVGTDTLDTASFCSRIAGLIAGTPLAQSVTNAVLPEVSDVERMSREELNTAINAGKLVLVHDGVKVKLGRGVTSLTTTTGKSALLKKIKLVETLDLIKRDLRVLTQDTYIGKLPNSYDNKVVLLGAYLAYLKGLEAEGILQAGTSSMEIDVDAQRAYLKARGDNVADMTDAQIKTADTDEHVFVKGNIRMLDAIEDVAIDMTF